MKKLLSFAIKIIKPFLKFISDIRLRTTKTKVTGVDYYMVRDKINPLCVLMSKTYGEASNLINPLEFKHGALYLGLFNGVGLVFEVVGDGARIIDLVSFMTDKDIVVGYNFIAIDSLTVPQLENLKEDLVPIVNKYLPLKYDWEFDDKSSNLYCFEGVCKLIKEMFPQKKIIKEEIVKDMFIYSHNSIIKDTANFYKAFDTRELNKGDFKWVLED